ncbi:MAG: hypothetical protein BRC34_13230 [Cyanobacteria bacterium QH_1_48_107]|nr:MAG: hypothetical protein BRC34_13230 [Cyanobacteria bacterium QH_1_48_107]
MVDLKAEDDSGTVALGGEEFSVETAYYPNTLILKQLTAKDITDHPRWDGEDEPRVTVYPNGSGVNPNGSGIEYEFYSEGEGKGMSIGETKSFQSTGKNNYLSADSDFIDFDLHEKDSNGYNWVDFGTETNTKGGTDSFVFFSERGEADNIEEADYVLRFQIT